MTPESRAGFRLTPQIILGLCIIAFGVALTADNLGYGDAGTILEWWPVAIILVGVTKAFQSSGGSGRVVGGVIMFVGVALLGESLDIFRIWAWWPMALIALGAVIVFRALGGSRSPRRRRPSCGGQ